MSSTEMPQPSLEGNPDTGERPIVLLQITDTHLFASTDTKQRGINTQESLDAVLANASADACWPPDAIIVTGDIVLDERVRAPVTCVPGKRWSPVGPACLLPGSLEPEDSSRTI